jgi:acyl-CoA reductase-like NAD-dependent aldehyde dehydrogenase
VPDTAALIEEVFATGTLKGLPNQLFIDGAWRPAPAMMETFDPGSGKAFAEFGIAEPKDVDAAVEAAHKAQFGEWRRAKPSQRCQILLKAAELVRADAARFAVVETLDTGKTLAEAQGDIANCARTLEYYGGLADKLEGSTIPLGPDYFSYTILEPVGVTAHIIPWNYPTTTLLRGAAPALAAGCTVVAKPAETSPMTALMMAEVFQRAGLPAGVFSVVPGLGASAGAALVAHEKVRHVTFTGSVQTGIAAMQSAARHVASVTLELGGKSPIVVLADADLDAAVEGIRWAIYSNAGQVCSAGSRLIVERKIHGALLKRVVAMSRALRLRHGLRNGDVGAINSTVQLERIVRHMRDARQRGLQIATGGSPTVDPDTGTGWFFEPTVIDGLQPGDRLVQEEIFGPVLVVQVADDAEQALKLANDTEFGLVAGIYTRDFARAMTLARDIDAGQIFINEYFAGGVEVPFGGNKRSGFGREKGIEGVRAYTRVKAVAARL